MFWNANTAIEGLSGSASCGEGFSGTAGSAGADASGSGASSEEQTVYAQSFDALKAGSYSVAITGFKDFLNNYPSSPLAENAQYWPEVIAVEQASVAGWSRAVRERPPW